MNIITDLSARKNIQDYVPMVGDWIDWRGWIFGHWCGPVNKVEPNGDIIITTAGLPYLVFIGKTNQKTVKLQDIISSVNGEFSISRAERNILLWFA